MEKLIFDIVKRAMPHVELKDDKAVDLYFEELEPAERKEIFDDLNRGIEIETADFGSVGGHAIRNFVHKFTENDLKFPKIKDVIRRLLNPKTTDPLLEYDENRHKYKLKASEDLLNIIFTLKDIPKKRKYIFDRIKKIYPKESVDSINQVLDAVKVQFRNQKEKGASSYKTKEVFITSRELKRNNIYTKTDAIEYLDNPASVVTHEIMHIFQNILKSLPNVKYNYKEDGEWKIDYMKYITDPGELQSRLEQIIEMLKWGFEKPEIVQLLYSRKHGDPGLWTRLVEKAEEMAKKARSQLPMDSEQSEKFDDQNHYWSRSRGDQGNNYQEDYISSGHLDDDVSDVYKTILKK